jgi:hypothetical protein
MTQSPGPQPSQVPPESPDGLHPQGQHSDAPRPPRRRLSWPRGRKRLTAGIAAFGLLLAIGAIGSAAGIGETAVKVADPGARSTTAGAKASTRATVKASTGATVKASTGATAKAGTGATAKASPGPSAKASTGSSAKAGTGATAKARAKASAKARTKPSASKSTAAAPEASQDCLDQARAWLNGGSAQRLSALEDGFGALDAAGHAFVSAAAAGAASAGDISAVQAAAGALQSDAGAVEANPGPTCVPGLRANLMSGAADYSEVANAADSGMAQYEAGQVSAAVADVEAARPLVGEANASISAASNAAENFGG